MDTWNTEQVDVSVTQYTVVYKLTSDFPEHEIAWKPPYEQDLQPKRHQASDPHRRRRSRCMHGEVHQAKIPAPFIGKWKAEAAEPRGIELFQP